MKKNVKGQVEKLKGKAGVLLSLASTPAVKIGPVRVENGVPVYRFKKELIRTGHYTKASDGIDFEITPETIAHWEDVTGKFLDAGNKIPVPKTHGEAGNPEENAGWLVEAFQEGDSLYGVLDLYGDDAPKLAATSDVSIFVPPDYVDGKGYSYRRPITHVALCTDPVIPGLGGFEVMAASMQPINKEHTVDWTKIKNALGITDELTDENAETLVLSAVGTMTTATKEVKDQLAALTTKVADLEKTKGELELSLSPKKADPLLVSLASENRRNKLDALVAAAKITPAARDKLAGQFCDNDKLSLSLSKGGDNFDAVVDALKENDVVKLGEQSGAQVLSLSNTTTDKGNPVMKDVERRRKAAGLKD